MTIYEHMVRKAPENYNFNMSETDNVEIWLNGYSEDGWELVTATFILGVVHYVFRKPVEMH